MLLLSRSIARGERAAYVSRGYGGLSARASLVTCVGRGTAWPRSLAGLRVVSSTHPDLAREIGDEGAMVAHRVPDAALFFAGDKRRAVHAAAEAGCEVVVLDDAFQSWGVARHLDIVLLDAEAPLANGRVLPAGPLREPPAALARASVLVFNGAGDAAALARAKEKVNRWLRPNTRVAGLSRRIVLAGAGTNGGRPSRVLAVSGIARPGRFEASLRGAGVEWVAHEVFGDHHDYDERDARALGAKARALGADGLVTTEKDWVKLRRLDVGAPVWVARLEVELFGDEVPA
jgi:tetraacyldisaccharide 4'-kinase